MTGHELKSVALSTRLICSLKPFFCTAFSSHLFVSFWCKYGHICGRKCLILGQFCAIIRHSQDSYKLLKISAFHPPKFRILRKTISEFCKKALLVYVFRWPSVLGSRNSK